MNRDSASAPDGSPVEFYALLPPGGEPELIHAALPEGCEILELGCGAGRITHGLLALGHKVVAVDQSAAMLSHVHGAKRVLADIETLDLGRTFPGVVLASYLINRPGDERRAAFLRTCRQHVARGGSVLIERLDPRWAESAEESTVEERGVVSSIRRLRRDGRHVSAEMEYAVGARRWRHPFTARVLDDAEIVATLGAAGLRLDGWLDYGRGWLRAVPAPLDAAGGAER